MFLFLYDTLIMIDYDIKVRILQLKLKIRNSEKKASENARIKCNCQWVQLVLLVTSIEIQKYEKNDPLRILFNA